MTTTRPLARASVIDGYSTFTRPDGHAEHLEATEGQDIRTVVLSRATEVAAEHGDDIELHTSGELGEVHFLITPVGGVSKVIETVEDSPAALTERGTLTRAAEKLRGAPSQPEVVTRDSIPSPPYRRQRPAEPDTEPDETAPEALPTEPARRRPTFITENELPAVPATGWRRVLGLPVSQADQAMAEARRKVSGHWPKVRRIAVVNGKGGAGKTTTTACVSSVFARLGGGGVLAWDNNPTRGTLGWRTEAATHSATVQDLLEDADALLAPDAKLSAMAGYVHHQTEDHYDVLRSNPELLAIRQQVTAVEFDQLIAVIDRGYRLVVFDSGNDESADRWLRMIDHSHQLIVPTTASPEAAESAMLLLEALATRDAHSAELAKNAVVVVSDGERAAQTTPIAYGFREAGYRTEVIPFDTGLKSGALRFGSLKESTQNAWIRVAATAAQSF